MSAQRQPNLPIRTPGIPAQILGRGEMADRVRGHNWDSTPLGPVQQWSRELITAVNLTLSSPAPSQLLWGPGLILIYNQPYRSFMGRRHPGSLGRPALEVYGESWHVVGPLLQQALVSGEGFVHPTLRVPIETEEGIRPLYLDYSYTPMFEDGRVAGLFGTVHDVTAQVTAMQDRKETEARSHRVLQSVADAVIVTDSAGIIVQMNPVAESMTGCHSSDAAGRPLNQVFQIIDEATHQPLETPAEKILRRPVVISRQAPVLLVFSDECRIAIDHSGAPIFDDEGNLTGIVLVFRDIHERREAERERSALSGQLSLVLDAITDGVVSLDRNWTMVYRNRSAQQILQTTGELKDRNFWETFPGAIFEGSPFVKYYYRAMDEGIPGRFEAFYPEPLNAWFSVLVQPAEHGIVIFFHDVTVQRQEREALRESEARMSAMYSTSLEYIGLLTPDGIVLDCNRASLEFAGNRREDVVGHPFPESPWFTHTKGAPEKVRHGIAQARAGATFRAELPLVRPDGETILFDFSLTPVRDQSGAVIFIVPEGRDITEVKRAETALMQSEKLAAVGRLASSIAHEINNPLESVMNLIYLARHADGDVQSYLELADQEIRRVSIIANQTLRFHKQASSPQAVGAADLFSTVMSIYEGRLRNAHVQVKRRFRSDDPVVCFQGDVRQVLNNLVSNALEAMPFGGQLLIRSRSGRNWKSGSRGLILTVADNGSGIPPEAMQHMFEAFFTTKGTAGNGLGLWVSQEIVARHRGTLRVRSCRREGRSGTTFCLFLPFDGTGTA